ncbi:hypothetical protein FPZ12_025735 [Amycolatopsis acidicola]|uniref:Lipoprotein with Yx(FWY)xxD motif n=1 Tax=Amycolatopsis acidicola TaxID=2596893 RepID=A0A5N0UXV4_9PSEU|nr:hypothetical protein [Amycolatopsis acidicola]KAA9157190.1 hypothetical protein FPZ12_025735 [Amycolatopsis acidicola]
MVPRPAALAVAATLAVVVAGCGTGGGSAAGPPADLNGITTDALGAVVADAQGHVLYRFDGDTSQPPVSHCYGPCAETWRPVLTSSSTITSQGLARNLVSATTREDGSQQVTLAGWPLYHYVKDTVANQAAGQGMDGRWFAVTPAGGRAEASTSDSGGY